MPGVAASGVSPPVMIRVAHVMSGLDEVVRGVVGREVERSFRVVKAKVGCFLGVGVVFGFELMNECRSGSALRL